MFVRSADAEALVEADGFGMARIKKEGSPVHPEDLDWEHYPDECAECAAKWEKQLAAYNAYWSRHGS